MSELICQKYLEKKGKTVKKKEILARRKNKEFPKSKERKDREMACRKAQICA